MKPRIHGMDALRAIAMLLGVILHAVIAYRVFPNATWPRDPYQWIGYDVLYLWIHSFRMQVFFLVAGFFARLLYLKTGEPAFLRHRLKRIVVPLLVGTVVLAPLSVAPFFYYNYLEWQGLSVEQALAGMLEDMLGWNGLVHLWFLYYLLMFYTAMIAMIHLAKRIPTIRSIGSTFSFLADLTNPVTMVSIAGLIVTLLSFQDKLFLEAYTGIRPDLTQFIYYGLFFWIGYWIHHRSDLIEKISRSAVLYLIIGTLLVVPLIYLYTELQYNLLAREPYVLLTRVIGGCQTVFLVRGVLGGFIRFFSRESQVLRYISDATYWLYLIHLPVVVWLQVLLLHTSIYGMLRLWIVVATTTFIALLTYQWFVRYTAVGNILHGERRRTNRRCLAK